MSFGELMIFLNELACLLGLLVTSKSVCLSENVEPLLPFNLLVNSLDVSQSKVRG